MKNINKYIFIAITLLLVLSNRAFCQEDVKLIPSGDVIYMQIECKYPYIASKINKNDSKLKVGDIIKSINNNNLQYTSESSVIEDYMKQINTTLSLDIIRNNKEKNIMIASDELRDYQIDYKIEGIGTITAFNLNGDFYGLSHSIHLNNTKIEIQNSNIYDTKYIQEKKSKRNNIGNLITEKEGSSIGSIVKNSDFGIKGNIIEESYLDGKELEISNPKIGQAWILCSTPITNEKIFHEINITQVNENISKFELVDETLINYRGGLVRGMSGSPVIQDNKIIGGLRSIYTNNPKKGQISNINSIINQ